MIVLFLFSNITLTAKYFDCLYCKCRSAGAIFQLKNISIKKGKKLTPLKMVFFLYYYYKMY